MTSLVVVALLVIPGTATAQGPGGNAGVDEYTETVPAGGGSNPSSDPGGGGSGGSGEDALTPAQVAALEEQGPDGAAAAQLAQSTGPDRASDQRSGDNSGGVSTQPSGESGIVGALGDAADGSESGMGVALPIILGVALLGALGFLVARRSGGTPTGA